MSQLNNSKIYYKDIVIFKSGASAFLKSNYEEVLYDGLLLKELDESDIQRIFNTIKFINRCITEEDYSGQWYCNFIGKLLDKYEELKQRCSIQTTLNFLEYEINQA